MVKINDRYSAELIRCRRTTASKKHKNYTRCKVYDNGKLFFSFAAKTDAQVMKRIQKMIDSGNLK